MDNPQLAQQTLRRATQALHDNLSAGLPEIVELVSTLSEKAQEISVQELAVIVEKDAAVLAKILSLANAFGYNPTHTPISSVSAAIQVIGFERIRMLAISLLLFEQTNRMQPPEERRETAAGALFSGCFAKSAAERGCPVDPEEAFICASLRHFGRIVLCTFMNEEFLYARHMSDGIDEDEAFKRMFGLTPVELGYELLRAEHLPQEILSALKQCRPEKIASSENPSETRLALSDFATQVCMIVFDANIDQDDFAKRIEVLAKRFNKVLPGIIDRLPALLSAAETYLSRFNEGLGSRIIPAQCLRNLNHRLARTNPEKLIHKKRELPQKPKVVLAGEDKADAAPTTAPVENALPATPAVTALPADDSKTPFSEPASAEQKKLNELESLASDSSTSDMALNAMAVGILSRALDAPECILFLMTGGKDSELRIAQGLGRAWMQLKNKAGFRRGERSTLGLCLQRHENILIHDARDATISQHTPTWLKGCPELGAYVLVPILDRSGSQGLLLAGWNEKRRISVSSECMATIHAVNRILPQKSKGRNKLTS